MSDPVTLTLTASIKGLVDGLGTATSAVKKNTEEMQKLFGGLGKALDNLKAPFLALSGLLAGGALFKHAVADAAKWNLEVLKMSKIMGVSTQDASVLKVAIHGLGIEQETLMNATVFMSRQIANGGEGFRKLGVATKDSQGHLRPIMEVLGDTIDRLNSLKPGLDRNTAGVATFGRGWQEASRLLLLSKERIEEAAKEAEHLHLIVGPEGAKKAFQYRESIRQVGLVSESLKIQIGNSLLPTLTNLGRWMGESGPSLSQGLQFAINGLVQAFLFLKVVVQNVVTIIAGKLTQAYDIFKTIGKAFYEFSIKGDVSAAWAALQNGWSEFQRDGQTALEQVEDNFKSFAEQTKELWHPPEQKTAPKEEPAGENFVPEKGDEVVKQWKEQLERIKAERQNWFTWDAQKELAFWTEKLATTRSGTGAYRYALSEVNKARREVIKEGQGLQKQEAEARAAALTAEADAEENAVKQRASEGKLSKAEEIRALIDLERRKLDIKIAALEAEAAIEGVKPDQLRAIHERILEAQRAFNLKAHELNNELTSSYQKTATSFLQPFVQGFSQGFERILAGTQSFSNAVEGMFGSLRSVLAQSISGMVSDWIAGLAKRLAAWIAHKAMELLFHETTETAKAAATTTTATTVATANAVQAGSAAAATVAQTPVVGWAMAIPVGMAVLGGVMAMLSHLKSAAGGMDIPRGINPIIQAHAEEMMLPASIANPLRTALASGALGGGGGGRNVFNITAMDGRSVKRVLTDNEGDVARAFRKMQRRGRV